MAPKQLNFITGNKNKLSEVQAILGSVVEVQSQSIDLVEIQGTIEEISLDKCRRAAVAVSAVHSCSGHSVDVCLRSMGLFSLKIHACHSTH